jgi:hypothetical protein
MAQTIKDPPPKIARWVMTLQEYDLDVEYRAGKHHQNADALSRIRCDQVSVVSSTFLNSAVNLAGSAARRSKQLTAYWMEMV